MDKYERWSAEEWARVTQLLSEHDKKVVARIIGRSFACLVEKMRWEGMTEAQREARRQQVNLRRRAINAGIHKAKTRKDRCTPATIASGYAAVSMEALADRAVRQRLEHRDLTGAFFNDPLPGYSALDQRGQRA